VGGARSSKSYSIAQLLIQKFFTIPGRKIAVCRKTFPALRLTAYKLIVDLLSDYGVYGRVVHDRANHTLTNPANGAFLAFLSVDDPEKIKSTEWNDIWLEEANEFTWEDWLIIQTRLSGKITDGWPNQIYLSLNPSDEQGWINQRLMLTKIFAERLEVIESTYNDNPFLDDEYKQLLESLKDQDPNAYQIYAKGKWGILTNIIYPPYQSLVEFPAGGETIYGLDFGFNNPSALIEITIKDRDNCYLRELLYETHLTNAQLIDRLKDVIPKERRRSPLYADCAEPDRIEEIHKAGFNVHESDKEVVTGIDFCKRKAFFTLVSNINLNKERATYKWRQDKNGNVLDEPVKYMDHLMDAKRYAIYTHQKSMKVPTIRSM
jgi:phage terminase large subunit